MIRRQRGDARRRQYAHAIEFAIPQHHPQEAHVVRSGRDEPAAARTIRRRDRERLLLKRPSALRTAVDGAQAWFGAGWHGECRVAHAEGCGDVLLDVGVESLTARGLDHAAGPVDPRAVLPLLARVEHQQLGVVLGRCVAQLLAMGREAPTPQRVGQARGVRQEVTERDRPGRSSLRAVFAKHHQIAKLRSDLGGRPVEGELVSFHELHHGSAGDHLRHRVDTEEGVGLQPSPLASS